MTQQDYNNLLVNYSYYQGILAADVTRRIRIGSCDNCKLLTDLRLGNIILDVLSCYKLEKDVEIYNQSVVVGNVILGSFTLAQSNELSGVMIGDDVTASGPTYTDILPTGTKVVSIIDKIITFDHAFLYNDKNVTITFSRDDTGEINNCISRVEALGLVDVLNKIYNTNYCTDLLLG